MKSGLLALFRSIKAPRTIINQRRSPHALSSDDPNHATTHLVNLHVPIHNPHVPTGPNPRRPSLRATFSTNRDDGRPSRAGALLHLAAAAGAPAIERAQCNACAGSDPCADLCTVLGPNVWRVVCCSLYASLIVVAVKSIQAWSDGDLHTHTLHEYRAPLLTWTPRSVEGPYKWTGVASDATGQKLYAVGYRGRWMGPSSWSKAANVPLVPLYINIGSHHLSFIYIHIGYIFTSDDGGSNWVVRTTQYRTWNAVATSSDAVYAIVSPTENDGNLLMSNNTVSVGGFYLRGL